MGRPRARPNPPRPQEGAALLGGPAWRGPRTHLQGVPRDDQGTVMLPAEGIQLEVGLAAVGHLEGSGTQGCGRPCSLQNNKQQLPGAGAKTMATPAKEPWPSPAAGAKPDPVMILWEPGQPVSRPSPCISPRTAVTHIIKARPLSPVAGPAVGAPHRSSPRPAHEDPVGCPTVTAHFTHEGTEAG